MMMIYLWILWKRMDTSCATAQVLVGVLKTIWGNPGVFGALFPQGIF